MTERTVTIKLGLEDQIGNRLLEIRKQRDALLAKSKISLNIDAEGMEQAQRAAVRARQASNDAVRDMGLLGAAIGSKAVGPTAQYTALLGAALVTVQKLGPGMVTSLQKVSVEFQRQRTLAQFWGKAGYMNLGVEHLKSSLASFVSTSGSGFTKWLTNTSVALSQYRTALVASAAVMMGMATAAALSSKHAQNYIQATLDSRLMARKLSDRAGAEKWIQSAEGTDWSAGRESRTATFQTILSKNPYMGQMEAQKGTEDLEKFFFANQEMLKKKGFESVEALASAMSAPTMSGEDALKFEDIFGLGFQNLTPRARLGRVSTEAGKLNMAEEVGMRPEEILTKRFTATTRAMGDAVLPPLITIMNMFVKISDIVGKIPGLGGAMGWAAILTGIAAAGLTVISMIGMLLPGLITVISLLSQAALATKIMAAAQWLLNVAMTANPIGLAIVAVAALVAGLYILEKKFGVVTKAWNALKGGLAAAGNAFREGGGMGVMKLAVEAIAANNPMLKIMLMMADFMKKVWLNGEALNKIMNGAMNIWQSIGQFFGWIGDLISSILDAMNGLKEKVEGFFGSEEKKPLTPTEEQDMIAWAKKLEFDNGENVFNMDDETMRAALREAQTGVPQEHANMAEPGKYTRLVNSFKNRLANPSAGLGDVAPVEGATGNPFYNPAYTNAITGPGGIEIRTKPADEITGSQDVEGGLQMYGRMLWDRLFGGSPSMAAGGSIIGSGGIIGHAGEEISPASAVIGAKTTLERMNEAAAGGQGGSITVGSTTININVDKMSSDIDLERALIKAGDEFDRQLMFKLRNLLDSGSLRGIGYLRG